MKLRARAYAMTRRGFGGIARSGLVVLTFSPLEPMPKESHLHKAKNRLIYSMEDAIGWRGAETWLIGPRDRRLISLRPINRSVCRCSAGNENHNYV